MTIGFGKLYYGFAFVLKSENFIIYSIFYSLIYSLIYYVQFSMLFIYIYLIVYKFCGVVSSTPVLRQSHWALLVNVTPQFHHLDLHMDGTEKIAGPSMGKHGLISALYSFRNPPYADIKLLISYS